MAIYHTVLLRLKVRSSVPVYRQIVEEIKGMVLRERLKPDVQITSVRALSGELSVNPSTVAKAYQILTDDRVLDNRPGAGYFVTADAVDRIRRSERKRLDALIAETITTARLLGVSREEIEGKVKDEWSR